MLTPDTLHAMEPQERTSLFEALAAKWWGPGFAAKCAADMGVSRPTVFRWRREHNVPFPVIMLLERWTTTEPPEKDLVPVFTRLVEDQKAVADTISDLLQTVSAALRRGPETS